MRDMLIRLRYNLEDRLVYDSDTPLADIRYRALEFVIGWLYRLAPGQWSHYLPPTSIDEVEF